MVQDTEDAVHPSKRTWATTWQEPEWSNWPVAVTVRSVSFGTDNNTTAETWRSRKHRSASGGIPRADWSPVSLWVTGCRGPIHTLPSLWSTEDVTELWDLALDVDG